MASSLEDFLEKDAALAAEAERIGRKRADLQAQIQELRVGSSLPPDRKRLRSGPSPCSPKPWKMLREVQAAVSAARAAGELLSFGAPGRRPRVCTPPLLLEPARRGLGPRS